MSYDKQRNKEYLRERYAAQRLRFIEYLGGACVVCHSTENLQFDHIDPSQKKFPVSKLWAEKDLLYVYVELDKCQLLCEEHHLEKTKKEYKQGKLTNKPFTHGTMYGWMKKKCSCPECHKAKRLWYNQRNAKRRKKK